MVSRQTEISPKQERFAQEYVVDLNATGAAERAGYSQKTAKSQASRLLTNVNVQARIQQLRAGLAAKTEITAARVLEELGRLAFSDIGQVMDFSGPEPRLRPANEISEDARRSLSSVKVKRHLEGTGEDAREVEVTEFKLWSKDAALEKLGRHLGLWKADGTPVTVNVTASSTVNQGPATAEGLFAELAEYMPAFKKLARERLAAELLKTPDGLGESGGEGGADESAGTGPVEPGDGPRDADAPAEASSESRPQDSPQ